MPTAESLLLAAALPLLLSSGLWEIGGALLLISVSLVSSPSVLWLVPAVVLLAQLVAAARGAAMDFEPVPALHGARAVMSVLWVVWVAVLVPILNLNPEEIP